MINVAFGCQLDHGHERALLWNRLFKEDCANRYYIATADKGKTM